MYRRNGSANITLTYAISEDAGVILLLLVYDKSDASTVKNSAIKAILKDYGLNAVKLQAEGKLKPVRIADDILRGDTGDGFLSRSMPSAPMPSVRQGSVTLSRVTMFRSDRIDIGRPRRV